MRTCDVLRCLSATVIWQGAQCIGSLGSFLDDIDVSSSHQQPSQAGEQHRWRRDNSFSFKLSQPPQTESLPSTADAPQLKPTDGPTMRTDDFSSDLSITEPASTSETELPTPVTTVITITPSIARTPVIPTAHVPSTSSSSVIPAATTSAIPSSESKPFQMSAASIAATVVLCSFVCGGAAIMLYYRIRRCLAWRKRRQWNSLAPDSDYGGRPKSFGDSLVSSGMSARESIMFHYEHRQSGSATLVCGKDLNQRVTEQEPPYDYRIEYTDIPMGDIEPNDKAECSPVSPLLPPTFPRPVSSNSRNGDRQSLRREFSFEITHEPPISAPRESNLDRRSALSSNPPSDWPLAMPSYYGRGFPPPPRSGSGYQAAPTEHRSGGGWHSVVQKQRFEDVQTRGGYYQPGQ